MPKKDVAETGEQVELRTS